MYLRLLHQALNINIQLLKRSVGCAVLGCHSQRNLGIDLAAGSSYIQLNPLVPFTTRHVLSAGIADI